MGWRGAGGNGAAETGILLPFLSSPTPPTLKLSIWPWAGVYFFFGGVLMILGSIGEWVVGNTFPFVVFGTFGTCVATPLVWEPIRESWLISSFVLFQAHSGQLSAQLSSLGSTHMDPMSQTPNNKPCRWETRAILSVYKRPLSMPALPFSCSSWVPFPFFVMAPSLSPNSTDQTTNFSKQVSSASYSSSAPFAPTSSSSSSSSPSSALSPASQPLTGTSPSCTRTPQTWAPWQEPEN